MGNDAVRIPLTPRQFLTLKLKLGEYQRKFLKDSTLKRGSITLTERVVIVASEKMEAGGLGVASVLAYDTNELSLDGVLPNLASIRPIHADLRRIAKMEADHFKRRRRVQARLVHSQRKLNAKLASDRDRERRRVDAVQDPPTLRAAASDDHMPTQNSMQATVEGGPASTRLNRNVVIHDVRGKHSRTTDVQTKGLESEG